MSKTILIKEDSLQTIKEKVVDNSNIISPNDVCVNEAAPEVDEYTIGGEEDSPVGGRYYHASEENNNIVTESKNSNRAHRQTRQIIAKYMGTDENDPTVAKAEQEFEAKMFDEGKRTDWMIVLEPIAYNWYLESEDINLVKKYVNYIYLKATETTPPSAYIANVKKFGTFNEVKQFLDQQKKADDEASRAEQANMSINLNKNYEVRGPLTYDEANEIGNYSCPNGKICYTQSEDTWESEDYGNYGTNKCYVLLCNGWEDIPAEHDGSESNNGLPTPLNQFNGYDKYGLSMIFVWIGKFGNLSVSNTRWNHAAEYAPGHSVDLALTELDIAKLMSAPFEQVFGVKKTDINAFVKKKLNNPEVYLDQIFDDIYEEHDGITAVRIGNKYNYVVKYSYNERYLLWDKPYDEWFDSNDDFFFNIGMGIVYLDGKAFFIDKNGKLHDIIQFIKSQLSNGVRPEEIFDIDEREPGVLRRITFNWRKFNFINLNTKQILWDKPYEEWFEWAKPFEVGIKYTLVRLNQKLYYLDVDGNLHDFLECLREKIKHENLVYVFDDVLDEFNYNDEVIRRVKLYGKYNFVNVKTKELIWDKPFKKWFPNAYGFYNGYAKVTFTGGVWYNLSKDGKLYNKEGKLVEENRISFNNILTENIEPEVESSEVDLSSFKKKDSLVPSIWKDEDTLNSKVRLKLLDIADDFWEFVNITWVEPKGIILTGSICNFNWSKFSDIDLHLIVDFDEIDDRDDFVRDYMDAKKNEWNNEHKSLKIMDYPVELYVQNIDEMPEAGGIYDLEENKWLRKPNKDDIKPIGLNKFSIKDRAATIMTIIDDMWDVLNSTDDMYDIRQLGKDASKLWDKVKKMRKNSLSKNGEGGAGNIVYKVMRRMGYLDKIFDLRSAIYDKLNSVTEATKQYKKLIMEYLDKDYGMPLYNYFKWAEKATDKEKAEDLINQCPYILGKYFEDISGYYDDLDELICEFDADNDLVYDEDFLNRVLDVLEKNKLLRRLLNNVYNYAYAEELPTWMTMDFIRLVKNEWCIHFTSDAYNISREGFTGGTPEIDDLAYSGAGRQKHYAGYDFAFLIHDSNVNFNGYGDEAVIFRASGVLARHYGDEEDQVIFWGPSVKEIIPIKKGEYSRDWEIEGLDGQIFKTGKPSELAGWATDNLPQYRKQILAGKSGYIPYGFSRPPYYNESVEKQITEEIVADGNAEHNPFEKRWKAERKALKDFLVNCGKIMTSKENGKQYKVYFDQSISDLIGYNYCICVQWNPIKMKPESTIYIRALDKFTNRIFHAQYDDRGKDNMRGTMDDTGYSQRFEAKRITKQMITESQESKSIAAAKKLAMQRLGYNEQEADEFVRVKLRNDIPSLRTPQGGKFILGATRMFCDGELRNANDIGNLNSTLKLVASDAHINEYDRNLNGLSCQELVQRFAKAMSDNLEAEKAEINQMVFDTPSDYEIVRIDSFEQAEEYGDYVSWCVTHDEYMFDSYTCNGINQFYFCLKHGFEHVDEQPGKGCPLDEYGLSMIAVSVNENGMLNTCTCRWNHDNGGDDSIMNSKEVSQVIGMNFFEVFKPNNKWKELLADVKQRLANGEDPRDVFDDVGDFIEGFAVVELNGKRNFINQDGRFLSDQWFDYVGDFGEGFVVVELNGKLNFINQEGSFISDQWFDGARDFYNGFAAIRLNEKCNFINQEGRIVSDQWFDYVRDFYNGFAAVKLNEKWNFINQDGRIISDQWFDVVYDFREGFAVVELNDKRNFINQEGIILSDQWFDNVLFFKEGFAAVRVNEKYNFINKEGSFISDQWFDDAHDSKNGFAVVALNGKWNYINQEGRFLSGQWFDDADDFYNGFASVDLNGKRYRLDTNGNLTLRESKKVGKQMITEANNKKRFKRQTLNVLAQGLGLDPNDSQLQSLESDFRNVYFGHLSNQEIDRVIGYEPLFAKCALDLGFPDNNYNDIEFTKYVNYLILNTKDKPNYTEIINHYKSKVNSFDDMRNVVGGEIKAGKEADAEQQANMGSSVNPNYQVLGPLTFDEAKRYGNRSGRAAGEDGRICYSQYEDTWLSQNYSNKNKNKCYILLRNDWQDLKGFEHDGSEKNNGLGELSQYNAYDNYGLSMIMLFINPEGELHECNVRWNHGIDGVTKFAPGRGVDHALTEMDIANLMGVPFEQVFNVKKIDIVDNIKKRLANGENPSDIFDYFGGMELGVGVVELDTTHGKKWNYLTEDGNLLWDKPLKEWFDSCSEWDYENEVGRFRIGGKFNFIKSDGTLLLRGEEYPDKTNWPDYLQNFEDKVNFDIPVATANFGLHWAYLGLDGKLYDYKGNLEV